MLESISVEDAYELACGYWLDRYDPVHDEIIDHSRWEVHHRIVFRDRKDSALYGFDYAAPATEYQESSIEERFDGDPVPVFPIVAKTVTATVYERDKP